MVIITIVVEHVQVDSHFSPGTKKTKQKNPTFSI